MTEENQGIAKIIENCKLVYTKKSLFNPNEEKFTLTGKFNINPDNLRFIPESGFKQVVGKRNFNDQNSENSDEMNEEPEIIDDQEEDQPGEPIPLPQNTITDDYLTHFEYKKLQMWGNGQDFVIIDYEDNSRTASSVGDQYDSGFMRFKLFHGDKELIENIVDYINQNHLLHPVVQSDEEEEERNQGGLFGGGPFMEANQENMENFERLMANFQNGNGQNDGVNGQFDDL